MTTYFVTRHSGALEWAARQGLSVDRIVEHLDPVTIQPGDRVVGTLPVNLAAEVCARGAAYWHLTLDVPPELRGKELTADMMQALGARIEEYRVEKVASPTGPTDRSGCRSARGAAA